MNTYIEVIFPELQPINRNLALFNYNLIVGLTWYTHLRFTSCRLMTQPTALYAESLLHYNSNNEE